MTATERQWETLARFVDDAIAQHPADLAADLRALVAADRWRVIAVCDLDTTGQPDPSTLAYRIDLQMADGWAPLAKVHWSRLPGIGDAEVRQEVANLTAQRQMGITVESWSGDLR